MNFPRGWFKEFIRGNTEYIDPTGAGVFSALLFGITKSHQRVHDVASDFKY